MAYLAVMSLNVKPRNLGAQMLDPQKVEWSKVHMSMQRLMIIRTVTRIACLNNIFHYIILECHTA